MRSSRASISAEGRAAAFDMVSLGSFRHQLSPICSALSIEQTRRRTWIVSSSTFAKLILMSPAMTRPLSSTRSRMSTRPCVRVGFTNSGMCQRESGSLELPQPTQRPEVDVEIFVGQTKDLFQLVHPVVQLEQRETKALHLLLVQRATIHPPNRLVLQDFA